MRALVLDSFPHSTAAVGPGRDVASIRRVRSSLARVRRVIAFALIGSAVAAAIIGLRVLFWAIGHPNQPFFRELAKLWS